MDMEVAYREAAEERMPIGLRRRIAARLIFERRHRKPSARHWAAAALLVLAAAAAILNRPEPPGTAVAWAAGPAVDRAIAECRDRIENLNPAPAPSPIDHTITDLSLAIASCESLTEDSW